MLLGWLETGLGRRPVDKLSIVKIQPVEGECHEAKHYVLGCKNLLLATDHKPLLGMFQMNLEDIENPREDNVVQVQDDPQVGKAE